MNSWTAAGLSDWGHGVGWVQSGVTCELVWKDFFFLSPSLSYSFSSFLFPSPSLPPPSLCVCVCVCVSLSLFLSFFLSHDDDDDDDDVFDYTPKKELVVIEWRIFLRGGSCGGGGAGRATFRRTHPPDRTSAIHTSLAFGQVIPVISYLALASLTSSVQ